MAAKISYMYMRSGGCTPGKKCCECILYTPEDKNGRLVFACRRHPDRPEWDGDWTACKFFTNEAILAPEEVPLHQMTIWELLNG